jgi:hypothetical protein
MSLIDHLNDKSSHVREYIHGCAPRLALAGSRGEAGKEWASAFGFDDMLCGDLVVPIPEGVDRRSHASVAGTAFDYRARMMLGALDPSDTVAASGVDRLAKYASDVENGEHRVRILGEGFDLAAQLVEGQAKADLGRASVLLAWCENVYRAFPQALMGSLGERLDAAGSGADLLSGVPEQLLADSETLCLASTPRIDAWKKQIVAGEEYAPNPGFEGSMWVGGADADWMIGNTLIDCKTTEKIGAPFLRETLFQLLGYALLDFEDRLSIRNVAVWLPRRAMLKSWSLDALIGADAESALPVLRKGLMASF